MANISTHSVWVLSPELENLDLQFCLRATEYRLNLVAGRIALRMGDLGLIVLVLEYFDTRRNGQPPKSQPTEKPTRAYNNQNATVSVLNK
jgi:hypothetical protein